MWLVHLSYWEGGNPPNPSWQFEWVFYHFPQACSVCVSKLEILLSFMSSVVVFLLGFQNIQ